jgi:hypothetical protein
LIGALVVDAVLLPQSIYTIFFLRALVVDALPLPQSIYTIFFSPASTWLMPDLRWQQGYGINNMFDRRFGGGCRATTTIDIHNIFHSCFGGGCLAPTTIDIHNMFDQRFGGGCRATTTIAAITET